LWVRRPTGSRLRAHRCSVGRRDECLDVCTELNRRADVRDECWNASSH
jgi:hypothetical protein